MTHLQVGIRSDIYLSSLTLRTHVVGFLTVIIQFTRPMIVPTTWPEASGTVCREKYLWLPARHRPRGKVWVIQVRPSYFPLSEI